MSSARLVLRSFRAAPRAVRPFSSVTVRFAEHESRIHDNIDVYRKHQMEKPLNPHLTNTTSTIANEMPSIGKDNAPPELITNVDPEFVAKDSVPENTERMTGGTQTGNPESGVNADLKVGELEESSFRVEPLRRTGEDTNTTRARLLYQSRKRGTLESDLLMSTFADRYLETMSAKQLQQYDLFLDENDWDIYYWATQEPTPTSMEYAEGGGPDQATPVAQGKPAKDEHVRPPGTGEWAQTVGLFKPAYRPVPQRWKNSEVLAMLRQHVKDRSAGGVLIGDTSGEAEPDSKSGQGMAFMPELKNLDK